MTIESSASQLRSAVEQMFPELGEQWRKRDAREAELKAQIIQDCAIAVEALGQALLRPGISGDDLRSALVAIQRAIPLADELDPPLELDDDPDYPRQDAEAREMFKPERGDE